MTTVTSLTADRMLAIEAASVVDGDVIGGNLILTKHDGSQINAGPVTGPQGPQGPVGTDLAVLSAAPILDVGVVNQIRAGRQLGPADFGNIGLSAPAGLWNLSDLSDVSGNGRNLLNKGSVTFASGINGSVNTAAQFVGSTAQALYIPDTGVNDPFRISTGSFGCWIRCAKRTVFQVAIGKYNGSQVSWYLGVNGASPTFTSQISLINSGWQLSLIGTSDIGDDRWHFGVVTYDGSVGRIYCDGILETVGIPAAPGSGPIAQSNSPLNIGGAGADGSTASIAPMFGRVDEAFVTADVLSEEQIRNLYCAKILHTLAAVPKRVSLNIRRRKKGAALASADFSTQPLRLHNFSGGSLGDEGSGGVALTNNGAAVSVSGADGSAGNAFSFAGAQSLSSTDAGLPSGIAARSFGCWFKTSDQGTPGKNLISWCSAAANQCIYVNSGSVASFNSTDGIVGPWSADGVWHFVIEVEDNSAIDGVKRKLYFDGRLVGVATNLNSIALGGANRFRIGSDPSGTSPFIGLIDGVFVCDYALTFAQVAALYAKGSQALAPSPKNVGDHIEAMDSTSILAVFDTLHTQHTVDLSVN